MKCPACSESVPEEATVCPACDHELDQVIVGGAETPAQTAKSRPAWLVFGGAALAVLAIGVVAFAFFTGAPPAAATYADRIPADAVAYVEVDVQRLLSDDSKSLVEAFAPVAESATGEPLDVEAMIEEAVASINEELAGTDLSFTEDIASWATGPIAFAVFEGSGELGEQMAMVIGGDDPDALDALMAKIADTPEVTDTREIAGVEFLVFVDGDQEGLVGRSGSDLVVATDEDLAESLVTGEGDTLADDDAFAARLDSLAADPVMLFAVNGDVIGESIEGAEDELGELAPGMGGMGGLMGGQFPAGWMAGALTVESDMLRVDYVGQAGEDFPELSFDPSLTGAFPSETIAFFRVGTLIDQVSDILESPMFGSLEEEAESDFGVGISEALAVFSVDGAVGIWPSSDPELPVNAALIGVSDENQSAFVDRLAELAPTLGLPATPTDHGYSFAGMVNIGTRDTYTILSTDADLVAAAPDESFADSDLMQRASELVDGEIQGALDLPAVIDLVDGLVAAEDPEAARILECLPLGVAASGITVDGETFSASFAMEIVTPESC